MTNVNSLQFSLFNATLAADKAGLSIVEIRTSPECKGRRPADIATALNELARSNQVVRRGDRVYWY